MTDENLVELRNQFAGRADAIVQAHSIYGDVHITPLARPGPPPRQAPTLPTHYVNYRRQLDRMAELAIHGPGEPAGPPKVLVLWGPPGSGRTLLAARFSTDHRDVYVDGEFLAALGAGGDPLERSRAVLRHLLVSAGYRTEQLPEEVGELSAAWRSWSTNRRLVLIIDDATNAGQVEALLPGHGWSSVLVVRAGRLDGLEADIGPDRVVEIEPLAPEAARLLLVAIVGAERVEAEPEAVDALIECCRGLVTALRVAGTTVASRPNRPITRLVERLADPRWVLAEFSRSGLVSVGAVFSAAYERLDPLAQSCYRALGAHPGDGDVSAEAIAVGMGEDLEEVSEACLSLRDARLVAESADDRYQLVGLVDRHAEALAERYDGPELARGMVEWYQRRAVAASAAWMPARPWWAELWPDLDVRGDAVDPRTAREWMEQERVNLRSAAEYADESGELEWLCQLAVALWPLHEQGAHAMDMAEVNRLAARAAEHEGARPDWSESRRRTWAAVASVMHLQRGFAQRLQDDPGPAADSFAAAQRLGRLGGSDKAEASAVEALGLVRRDSGQVDEAVRLLRRNRVLAERLGVRRRVALARFHLGTVEPLDEALWLFDAAAAALSEADSGDERNTLAKIELWRGKKLIQHGGDLAAAERALETAERLAHDGGWVATRVQARLARADLAERRGDDPTAHLAEAEQLCRSHGLLGWLRVVRRRAGPRD